MHGVHGERGIAREAHPPLEGDAVLGVVQQAGHAAPLYGPKRKTEKNEDEKVETKAKRHVQQMFDERWSRGRVPPSAV